MIKDGLFLIDREYRIESQYSAALETIFLESDLGKKSFLNYLKDKVEVDYYDEEEETDG